MANFHVSDAYRTVETSGLVSPDALLELAAAVPGAFVPLEHDMSRVAPLSAFDLKQVVVSEQDLQTFARALTNPALDFGKPMTLPIENYTVDFAKPRVVTCELGDPRDTFHREVLELVQQLVGFTESRDAKSFKPQSPQVRIGVINEAHRSEANQVVEALKRQLPKEAQLGKLTLIMSMHGRPVQVRLDDPVAMLKHNWR